MTLQGHPPVWPLNLITEFGAVVPLSFFFLLRVFIPYTNATTPRGMPSRVACAFWHSCTPIYSHVDFFFTHCTSFLFKLTFLYAQWWFYVLSSLRSFVKKIIPSLLEVLPSYQKIHNWYINFIIYCLVWFDHRPKFVCGGRGRAGFSLPGTNKARFGLFGYGRREERQRGNSH